MARPDNPTPPQAELDALKKALDDAGTQLVGLNFYAGQLPGPDRGALSVPGEESERFRANVEVAAGFAASVHPGRGAPDTGALPLEDLLGRLRKAGYDSWIGLEYKPGDRPSAESFGWLHN